MLLTKSHSYILNFDNWLSIIRFLWQKSTFRCAVDQLLPVNIQVLNVGIYQIWPVICRCDLMTNFLCSWQIIMNVPVTSFELYPLPTNCEKECLDTLLPRVVSIVNRSLDDAVVPLNFKPLPKKPSLDKEVFKNYRLLSNLSFISKVLEKITDVRLEKHQESTLCITQDSQPIAQVSQPKPSYYM